MSNPSDHERKSPPSGQPDWDSFEPYTGPEEEELPRPLARALNVVAPVLLTGLCFVAGGVFTIYVLLGYASKSPRVADEELVGLGFRFCVGGGAAAVLFLTFYFREVIFRRK